jgi:disulfide bond formation protein DsbB
MMLYPQVIILGTALYIKDKTYASVYGIILSVFGLIISLYHHYLQMGGSQVIKCPAAGVEADCAKRFFFEFDFMTFPLMSGILFLFLIVLYTYILKTRSVTPNSSQ